MSAPNDLILYHYSYSPYARRIVWYLSLRQIPYAQCLQPPILPRPDISSLGISYRRIPVLAHGPHIYLDTRLILRHLESSFPSTLSSPKLGASSPDEIALERLLERWTVDSGIFARAAALIPAEGLKDPKFLEDRTKFSGRKWSVEGQERGRPEALVYIRDAFELLETTLLRDGREWILKTKKPTLADIEAVWPFHWLQGMPGALPADIISEKQFPKVFAWLKRFNAAVKAASAKLGKPTTLKGPDALKAVSSVSLSKQDDGKVDVNDPSGLKEGDEVEVWPIDSGFGHKDKGRLVTLNNTEIVLAGNTKDGDDVRIHMPRWGFRTAKASNAAPKL